MSALATYTQAGAVGRISLNRPEKRNAFTEAMHRDLEAALGEAEAALGLRCLVLTGSGGAFSAGQDLVERQAILAREPGFDLGVALARNFSQHVRRLARLPVPVIAGVEGVAAGAGVGLALAADIVLASGSAQFVLAFAKVGLVPDAGLTYTLPRRVGPGRALALSLTGASLDAAAALQAGLVDQVVPDERFAAELAALSERLAAGPTLAFARMKEVFAASGLDPQLAREAEAQAALGRSADYRAALAAFAGREVPRFEGR